MTGAVKPFFFALLGCLLAQAQAQVGGMVCTRQDDTSQTFSVSLKVTSTAFTTCFLLDYNMLIAGTPNNVYVPSANCNGGLSLVEAADSFTFDEATVTLTGINQCASISGTEIRYAMSCQRSASFNTNLGRVFRFTCDTAAPGQVLPVFVTSGPLTISQVPETEIRRQYNLNLFVAQAGIPYTAISTTQALSTPLRAIVCLDILNSNRFDDNGPKGIYLSSCSIRQPDTFNNVNQDVPITDSNGCLISKSTPLNPNMNLGGYFTSYQGSIAVANTPASKINADPNLPLNCFFTQTFLATTWARKSVGNVPMTLSCSVGVCTSTADPRCFSNNPTAANICTNQGAARKRRNTLSFFNNTFAEEIATASFVVNTNVEFGSDASNDRGDCFDKTTFIALTAILGVLLLIVLVIAVFMYCHLMKTSGRTSSHDDRSSASTASGIVNKGFY